MASRKIEKAIDTNGNASAAEAIGLRYVSDNRPGIRRRRCGKGFIYLDSKSTQVQDAGTLERIKGLVIPPAWKEVWICPSKSGHIQATGRDDRGRKQYIYHPEWARIRDEVKFNRMLSFARSLPEIRSRTGEHLSLRGLPKKKVLATVVRLLESTYARIGNLEYTRQNRSFGLTTLRDRHADISGSKIQLEFRGKRGKPQKASLRDRRIARIVQQCQEIPGHTLFQYYDEEGERQPVDSADVNQYIQEISGDSFTAKDFRTWGGSLLAMMALLEIGESVSKTEAKRNVVKAVKQVAEQLGNEPAACRKYYIHPEIMDAYMAGGLLRAIHNYLQGFQSKGDLTLEDLGGLELEEFVLVQFLGDCD